MRIGIGHDTHRLAAGGPLRLGGIDHACDCHLVGVSDADVLLHAVTDALLGAAALGDIGDWFPDSDPQNNGRDSAEMLRLAHDACGQAGYRIANLDCIVFAERPKLGTQKRRIAEQIASILAIPPNKVSVKAKTGEGLGPVGRGEAMMAECIVLLEELDETENLKS
jgi:2-C-methyl-D-erythritol 2,4-cyclodiphosphate synthase